MDVLDLIGKIKLDASQYISGLNSAQSQAVTAGNSISSALSRASGSFSTLSSSAGSLNGNMGSLKTQFEANSKKVDELQEALEKSIEETGEESEATQELYQELAKAEEELQETSDAINEMAEEAGDASDGMNDLSKEVGDSKSNFEDADDAADDLGNTFKTVNDDSANLSDGFTVMKGVVADLVSNVIQNAISKFSELATEVVSVGSSFESSMSNVGALSGATEEEMQLLSDTAKEFGSSTQFSASEAADALSYMALAGWDAQTSCDALGGVLDLAAASGMELASASDMVTDYMSAFSMSAEESSYFADLLAYAQSNANTTASGLGEAFKNCAANLNASGQDIETTTSLLSMMANQGLKGSEAGTALTAVMRDMTNQMDTYTDEAALAELAEEGVTSATGDLNDILGTNAIRIGDTLISVSDLEGNYRDLTDILADVEDATDGMGEAEKATALQSTFTSDSIKGLNLILNAGVDEAASFEEELRNCTGTASDMAATMNDNLSGDLTALNSKIEGVKITVYESLVPALRDGIDELSGMIDSVDWSSVGTKLGELTTKALNFATVVIDNADGIKDVITAVGTVLAATFVVNKITTFATSIVGLYKTYQTLKTAIEAAEGAQILLNAAQLATPIGLVTAAVAGLAAGLLYLASKYDENTEAVATFTEYEEAEIEKVYELKDSYEELADARSESISAIETEYGYYEDLADELDGLVDANGNVKEGYEDRVNFILTTLNEACGTEMELVDGVIEGYEEEKAVIEDLIETKKAEAILSASEDAYTEAIQNQNDALNSYITTQGIYAQNKAELADLEAEYASLINMTNEEYAELKGITDYTEAADALTTAQDELAAQITATQSAVGESHAAMDTAQETYEGYMATIQNYEGLSSAIISGDSEKISESLLELEYNFQTAETATRESLEQQVVDYETNLANLQSALDSGMAGVTDEMVTNAAAMVEAAKAEVDKLPEEVSTSVSSVGTNIGDSINSSENQTYLKGSSENLLNTALDSLSEGEDKATESGENFGLGYVGGLESTSDAVGSASSGMASTSIDEFNSTLGIQSPSTVTYSSGENFGQGFINGMSSTESAIYQKAYSLAQTAVNALKAGQEEGSPSKITTKSGLFFGEGYANGIEEMVTPVVSAVKNLTSSAIDAANEEVDGAEVGMSNLFTYDDNVEATTGEGVTALTQNDIDRIISGLRITINNYTQLDGDIIDEHSYDYMVERVGNETMATNVMQGGY